MVQKSLKKYILTLFILLVIDLTWLFLIMRGFYENEFSNFLRPEVVPIWSAIFAWLLIPLGIVLFVDKVSKNKKESLIYGGIYGLILYGVYDFTNYATLGNWTLNLVIVDVIWGTFLCSLTSFILKSLNVRIN